MLTRNIDSRIYYYCGGDVITSCVAWPKYLTSSFTCTSTPIPIVALPTRHPWSHQSTLLLLPRLQVGIGDNGDGFPVQPIVRLSTNCPLESVIQDPGGSVRGQLVPVGHTGFIGPS